MDKKTNDSVIKDFRKTGYIRALRIITLIVSAIYVFMLVFFLFISDAALFQTEYIVLILFAAVPVFLAIMTDVFPYIEYDRFRKSLRSGEYRAFLREYEESRKSYGIRHGFPVGERFVFFMSGIHVPDMKDIVWIYCAKLGNSGKTSLVLLARQRKFYITTVPSKTAEQLYERYAWLVKQFVPDLITGYSEENEKLYEERYNDRPEKKK